MRSAPASSLTNCQVLSTVVTDPSLAVMDTLPIVVAVSPVMRMALLATVQLVQPFSAKPASFGNSGSPPTK
jgi:hypothetical protein